MEKKKKKRKHIKAPVTKNFVHKSLNSSTVRLCLRRVCLRRRWVCVCEKVSFPMGSEATERKEYKLRRGCEHGEKQKLIMMK